ncbi:XXYS1_4_G0024060.mRNA.1.CDS.1 [Saccharomyces cerevisiae]|nr:EM14S01-3B_G0021450.mRNA.1.CDS.1 [Saccharomyces cerevisiae]CAD6640870.1 XXYS1_4_G0024060.mRNA.1.CDS.1 [Saccharomyces cerevisiae]CAI4614254.1 AMH_1a_G0039410.mRNA.1.CDS.1 [Saccharomyces cerevisiae]CAI4617206.1 CEI_1a_G0039310.mRNA.1.CDS.1 [Saccharomyces cerevisiae]CAI6783890.1 AMH_1a_G0039410.mRNA.1.CDS.1 [Saccharomyces cerevisiae]
MPHAWQSCIFDSSSRFVELFLVYNKQRLYFRSSSLLTAEFLRLTNEMQERTKSGAAPNARVLIGQALGAETRCALQFPPMTKQKLSVFLESYTRQSQIHGLSCLSLLHFSL